MSSAAKLRRFFWTHPEWWTVALCWSAWAVVLAAGLRSFVRGGAHGGHHPMSFAQEVPGWMLMATAMMLPLVLGSVRMAAVGSLWARRHRAVGGFLVGFFGPWLALGLAVAGLRQGSWAHTNSAAALGFAAAVLWQRTAMHRRAIAVCHRIEPLAPLGWRADLDCLRYGAFIGAACVWSCWPLMLACAFTGHSPVAMAGGMVVGISERWYYRPRTRTMLAVTLALALYYGALAGLGPNIAVAAPQAAAAAPSPEIVGSTAAAFSLGKGATRVDLAMHEPADPVLLHAGPQRRVFLNVEKMMSEEGSGPYDVYLNLPPNEKPAEHPELSAGELSMFGLAEASRSDGKHKAQGLYHHLEITDLYARLPSLPGWDPKRLTATFVPRYAADVKIQVARVTVSMARR